MVANESEALRWVQPGLPAREDFVIVAEALSQVSQ